MQIQKKTKTIASIFAAAFLFSTVLFSCNDSSTSTTTTTDSNSVAPVTKDSITPKAAPDSLNKPDSLVDSTKGGQNPPPKQK